MMSPVYEWMEPLVSTPMQVHWLAGLQCSEDNEWWVRTVFRAKGTGTLREWRVPIGMLPILSLGVWFDKEVLQADGAYGEDAEVCIPDVSQCEVMTSDAVSADLYPLPEGKAGTQRLFRYHTPDGDVIIPAIELIRALFVHNRALALALMRPAGIEQLYCPQPPGPRELATLQFTEQMPAGTLGERLAKEFAWMVFDTHARRSWDSVLRRSHGQPYVLFDPPAIKSSTWSFRGVRHGNEWLVLELYALSGRYLPCDELEYGHPSFTRVVRVARGGELDQGAAGRRGPRVSQAEESGAWTLHAQRTGTASHLRTKVADLGAKWTAFENQVPVRRVHRTVIREVVAAEPCNRNGEEASSLVRDAPHPTRPVEVAVGERVARDALPPLDFRVLKALPPGWKGDLAALEEAGQHLRELLPAVDIRMLLTALKPGRTVSMIGPRSRPAMVMTITSQGAAPVALLDIERSGISALSLMALQFKAEVPATAQEVAIQMMLDGFVEAGGHWPMHVERALHEQCQCVRIPKLLVPREQRERLGRYWAYRLIAKLGLS